MCERECECECLACACVLLACCLRVLACACVLLACCLGVACVLLACACVCWRVLKRACACLSVLACACVRVACVLLARCLRVLAIWGLPFATCLGSFCSLWPSNMKSRELQNDSQRLHGRLRALLERSGGGLGVSLDASRTLQGAPGVFSDVFLEALGFS